MNTAVIYARVSSTGDRQNTDRQVVDLQAYAQDAGIDVVRVFQEKISGAKRNEERPVLQECLAFCRREHPDALLVSELSRLGRNTVEILKAIDELSRERVSVYVHNIGLSTLQPDGRPDPVAAIVIPVMGEVARIERENIRYRLDSGRKRFVAAGGHLGRPKGTGKTSEELLQEYPGIVRRLKKGQTIRDIAQLEGKSESTVKKVKKALQA
ncbi:MAG: recombinase family protein [Paludibacteraceae bacterium]|nr:recombinase family protein [Paludibacteraceae bacterium]